MPRRVINLSKHQHFRTLSYFGLGRTDCFASKVMDLSGQRETSETSLFFPVIDAVGAVEFWKGVDSLPAPFRLLVGFNCKLGIPSLALGSSDEAFSLIANFLDAKFATVGKLDSSIFSPQTIFQEDKPLLLTPPSSKGSAIPLALDFNHSVSLQQKSLAVSAKNAATTLAAALNAISVEDGRQPTSAELSISAEQNITWFKQWSLTLAALKGVPNAPSGVAEAGSLMGTMAKQATPDLPLSVVTLADEIMPFQVIKKYTA